MVRKKTLVFEENDISRNADAIEHGIIAEIPFLVGSIAKERTLSWLSC